MANKSFNGRRIATALCGWIDMKQIFVLLAVVFISVLSMPSYAGDDKSTAIISKETNTCWDVQDFSTADGAIIQMYPCTGTSNQAWQFQVYNFSSKGFLTRIVNVGSGMCAALESLDPASGAIGLRQHPCNANDATQQWLIDGYESHATVSGNNYIYFSTRPTSRRITNVGINWCLTAQKDFSRPYVRSDCSSSTDNKIRFVVFGL